MTTLIAPAKTSTWAIDSTHSIAEFAVKHLIVTTVKGRFRDLEGSIEIDEAQPENSSVEAKIAISGVDTNLEGGDNHVRSDDFFNGDQYPHITFHSTRVERLDQERFKLIGDLSIRDVTKEVVLDGEYEGEVDDPWGNHPRLLHGDD